jgi:ornithine cyclodeaminase/alanine dehydrogenase-like protein (mu-crystallin family)
MGAHTTESRELPAELLLAGPTIVEDLATAIAEAGQTHSGAIELADLTASDDPGLRARRTVFASTGCAYLDLITCAHLVDGDRAERRAGTGDTGAGDDRREPRRMERRKEHLAQHRT